MRTNIVTNYAGQGWIALMSVAFIPVYVRMLGSEAFGLVGIMLSLQAISTLLDLGMGGVLNRELARRSHSDVLARGNATLVRTLEWIVWPLAVLIGLIIVALSATIQGHWLHAEHLAPADIQHAIVLIGWAVAALWPTSFYINGLSGLERQPLLNAVSAGFATVRSGGAVVAMLTWGPRIDVFLAWHVATNLINSGTMALLLWRCLPPANHPRFAMHELRSSGRFAGGLLIITILAVALSQLDRLVISHVMPLSELGFYTVAVSVVGGFGRLIQPMFNAMYPRFSRLVAQGLDDVLTELYHLGNQLLAVVVFATAWMLIVFAQDLLYLWTGQADIAAHVANPLRILVAAAAINGLINLPYALQLAHGWTRLTIVTNLACLVVGIPYAVWATENHGLVGAATIGLGVNLASFLVNIPVMHSRLLRGEFRTYLLADVVPAGVVAGVLAVSAKALLGDVPRTASGISFLMMAGVVCAAITAACMPRLRHAFRQHFTARAR
ncbi:MAG: oligosaccharide flippase family protein [Luteibacter sp.]